MSEAPAPKGIDTPPAPGQLIEHDGVTYNTIREGLAHILVPPNARTSTDPKGPGARKSEDSSEQAQSVFYNPIQQFNRDLSVLAIKAFGEDVCARRKQKALQARAKKDKKDKKRQPTERSDDAAESKRRKTNDGSAVVANQEAHTSHSETEKGQQTVDPVTSVSNDVGEADQVGDTADLAQTAATAQDMDIDGTAAGPQAQQTPEYKPKFRILDALSATGLRALRYAREIPFATSVVSNDMSEAAVASIALNVRHNRLTDKISPSTGNAIGHMYQAAFATVGSSSEAWAQGKYDVVDLDPYGTAVPFLDAAIQCLNDGGMLCVTCTDAGVFASCGYVEKTYSLYGGLPIKGLHSHEAGLRLILNSIATSAAKYGIAIEPLLSLSIDYYARVFVRVRRSPADVKFLAGKTMLVHQCDSGCGAWQTQYLARHTAQSGRTNYKHGAGQSNSDRNCPHCGFKTHVAGPMWGGPIHNPYFIERILDALPKADEDVYHTTQRIEGMLTSALDELDVLDASAFETKDAKAAPLIPAMPPHVLDHFPFFFVPSALSKVLHCVAPSEAAIKGALRKAGFVATRSHTKPGTIKTQASWEVVWEVMREWVRQKAPVKEGKVVGKMPGTKIMQKMRGTEDYGVDGAVQKDASALSGQAEGNEKGKVEINGAATERRGSLSGAKDPSKMKIVFDEVLGKDHLKKKLTRYQTNPRENWGPMARAKGHS